MNSADEQIGVRVVVTDVIATDRTTEETVSSAPSQPPVLEPPLAAVSRCSQPRQSGPVLLEPSTMSCSPRSFAGGVATGTVLAAPLRAMPAPLAPPCGPLPVATASMPPSTSSAPRASGSVVRAQIS